MPHSPSVIFLNFIVPVKSTPPAKFSLFKIATLLSIFSWGWSDALLCLIFIICLLHSRHCVKYFTSIIACNLPISLLTEVLLTALNRKGEWGRGRNAIQEGHLTGWRQMGIQSQAGLTEETTVLILPYCLCLAQAVSLKADVRNPALLLYPMAPPLPAILGILGLLSQCPAAPVSDEAWSNLTHPFRVLCSTTL